MRWPKYLLFLLVAGSAQAEIDGYLLGAGLAMDSGDGFRGSALAGVSINNDTFLSTGLSASSVDLASGRSSDLIYADIELDHFFDPLGFTIGAAYWGDPDLLASQDLRASAYYRNDRLMFAAEYEYRDFDFIIPPTRFFPGREFAFDADGFGARLRYSITTSLDVSLSAMQYDYSVDFRPDENRDAVRLLTVSRLGLINNLIDSRASLGFSLQTGQQRWGFDYSSWKGALDRSRTDSFTVNYLRPLKGTTDIEFALGYDDSDLYGGVTFFSLYLYFYGS